MDVIRDLSGNNLNLVLEKVDGTLRTLLGSASTVMQSQSIEAPNIRKIFVANGRVSSGIGDAIVHIDVSLDNIVWINSVVELVLSLSTTVSGVTNFIDNPWRFVRARITAISGTNPIITVKVFT